MARTQSRAVCLLAFGLAACGWASLARAQSDEARNYPQRTIRLIVPYAPAGGTDILGRVAAQELSEVFGQPVIVENKPGAGAIIGTELVAKAKPDGYTLLVAPSGPLILNPVLRKSIPYSQSDFIPVSIIGRLPLMVTVNAAHPAKSVKELVDYAKARPNEVTYASSAPLFLLATELFKQKTGTSFVMIPYKSSGESAVGLLTGQVTLAIADVPPVISLIKDGKLRALAFTDTQRSSEFPDVPTVAEAGLPGTEVATLVGIVAPAGTPEPIVRRLQDALIAMVNKPEVRQRLAAIGVEPVGSTSEDYIRTVASEIARWDEVAKRANIEKQ